MRTVSPSSRETNGFLTKEEMFSEHFESYTADTGSDEFHSSGKIHNYPESL